MALIEPADYESVRRALRVGLDAESVPDAVIADPLYAPAACEWVLAFVPAAESLPEPGLTHCKNAAILLCAALLCDVLPDTVLQTWGALSVRVEPMDWQRRKALLVARAQAEIGLADPTVVLEGEEIPAAFTVAHGYRGRVLADVEPPDFDYAPPLVTDGVLQP